MRRSDSIGALAAALAEAQIEMVAAQMDATNPHFKSKYATLASVLEAIKPIHSRGLALVQTASVDRRDGAAYVTVETTLAHKSGEWVAEVISLKPMADNPQAVGSAITYGRRYLAAAVVGIASDDDDDGNGATKLPAKPQPKVEPSKKQAPAPKTAAQEEMQAYAANPPKHRTYICHKCGGIAVHEGFGPVKCSCGHGTLTEVREGEDAQEKRAAILAAQKPVTAPVIQPNAATTADECNAIRKGLQALGCKTRDDMAKAIKSVIGREVQGTTDLSADERKAVLVEIARQQAMVKEEGAANG